MLSQKHTLKLVALLSSFTFSGNEKTLHVERTVSSNSALFASTDQINVDVEKAYRVFEEIADHLKDEYRYELYWNEKEQMVRDRQGKGFFGDENSKIDIIDQSLGGRLSASKLFSGEEGIAILRNELIQEGKSQSEIEAEIKNFKTTSKQSLNNTLEIRALYRNNPEIRKQFFDRWSKKNT